MNPIGKVFTPAELGFIAGLMQKHDTYAVCDEVYEHLVFDGVRHRPLMTLPGMRERTLRIGSAGKTFSLTGWKVGYISGPAALMSVVAKAHQNLTFTTPPNLQRAGRRGGWQRMTPISPASPAICRPSGTIWSLACNPRASAPLPSGGSYFVLADYSALDPDGDDAAFCMRLVEAAGVRRHPALGLLRLR